MSESMTEDRKTPKETAELIKGQAILSLGPWPHDLRLFIFASHNEWSCGLSPATQTSDAAYRDGVLQIAQRLKKTVAVRAD